MELNEKKKKSGKRIQISFFRKCGKISIRKIVPESGTQKARLSCVGERVPMSNIDMIL